MSLFKVAGISTHNGNTKVRFANDLVSRVKMLVKGNHANIELMELPSEMTKAEAVNYLKTTDLASKNPLFAEAIANADEKYNQNLTFRLSRKKEDLSLDSIKKKAGITS